MTGVGAKATAESLGPTNVAGVTSPLTLEARQRGGQKSGQKRRDESKYDLVAMLDAVNRRRPGQSVEEALRTHYFAPDPNCNWHALNPAEQKQKLDNAARFLRRYRQKNSANHSPERREL